MKKELTPAALFAAIKAVAACIGPNCEGAMMRAVAGASVDEEEPTPFGADLRDLFAAHSIGPMLNTADTPVHGWAEYVASGAYHLADAMLNERESPRAALDSVREDMAKVLFAVLDELGDGTGRTSPDSFLPQALVDRIEAVLSLGGNP